MTCCDVQIMPDDEQMALEQALNECIAVATKIAAVEQQVAAESHAAPAQPAAPVADPAPRTSAVEGLLRDAAADGDEGNAAPAAGTAGMADTAGTADLAAALPEVAAPMRAPPIPWSRNELDAMADADNIAFRVVRAAVLTQPLLVAYFESPMPLTFL